MSPTEKQQAALQLMNSKGIRQADYHPPGIRILWGLGIDCPPPMMATFVQNALVCGGFFGVMTGAFSYFGFSNDSAGGALFCGLAGGIFFGLTMATYFRFVRRKHNLPLWRDLTMPQS